MHNLQYSSRGPIGWICPRPGEVEMNCDGSVTNSSAKAVCGGVLRGEVGNFILGYAANLGSCSILVVEQLSWANHSLD